MRIRNEIPLLLTLLSFASGIAVNYSGRFPNNLLSDNTGLIRANISYFPEMDLESRVRREIFRDSQVMAQGISEETVRPESIPQVSHQGIKIHLENPNISITHEPTLTTYDVGCNIGKQELIGEVESISGYKGISDFGIGYIESDDDRVISFHFPGDNNIYLNQKQFFKFPVMIRCGKVIHELDHLVKDINGKISDTPEKYATNEEETRDVERRFLESRGIPIQDNFSGLVHVVAFKGKVRTDASDSRKKDDLVMNYSPKDKCSVWVNDRVNNIPLDLEDSKNFKEPIISCEWVPKIRDYAFINGNFLNPPADATTLGRAINSALEAQILFNYRDRFRQENPDSGRERLTGFIFGKRFFIPKYDLTIHNSNSVLKLISDLRPTTNSLFGNVSGFVFEDRFYIPVSSLVPPSQYPLAIGVTKEIFIGNMKLENIVEDMEIGLSVYQLPEKLSTKYGNNGFKFGDGFYHEGQPVFWVSAKSDKKEYAEGEIESVDASSGRIIVNYPLDDQNYSGPIFNKNRNEFIGMVVPYNGKLRIIPIKKIEPYILQNPQKQLAEATNQ